MYQNPHWKSPFWIYNDETFGFRFCYTKIKIALLWASEMTQQSIQAGRDLYFHVWSKEITNSSARFFIVATREDFHGTYMHVMPKHRTFYEIIRKTDPCKLFFDIECSLELNPEFDYNLAMDVFRKRVCFEMMTYFSDRFPRDVIRRLRDNTMSNHFFIEKDSTNGVKFSRHLIFFVQPGVVFRNYKEVKSFVNRLLTSIHKEALFDSNSRTFQNIEAGQDASKIQLMRKLFVLKSIGGEARLNLMIDNSIYTKDRNFRLVLSSKFKAQPKRFCYPFNGLTNFRDERPTVDFAYFQSALISFSRREVEMLNMITINVDDQVEIPMDVDNVQLKVKNDVCFVPGRVRRRRLAAPSNYRRRVNQRFPQLLNYFESYVIKQWPEYEGSAVFPYQPPACYAQSQRAYITSVKISADERELVSISVVNNRFCWHVGRRHKSNNIFFQITPATFSFCQKCYDTDCRGATSPLFPIPVRFF